MTRPSFVRRREIQLLDGLVRGWTLVFTGLTWGYCGFGFFRVVDAPPIVTIPLHEGADGALHAPGCEHATAKRLDS